MKAVLSVLQQDEACTRYLAGDSCATVAYHYGVHAGTIFALLKRRNIPRRSVSEAQVKPMLGKRFDRLKVLARAPREAGGTVKWICACDCGTIKPIDGNALRRGDIVSCGCYLQERRTKHGLCKTAAYALYESARSRAKRRGLVFTLQPHDITIPSHCPVLGIPLERQPGACSDNSPTLDRIDPQKGYTKENVQVISHRANSIKRSASLEELELVAAYMRKHR